MSRKQIIIGGTWAVATAFGLVWGLVWLLLPVDDAPSGTAAIFMLSLVSLSLGTARLTMLFRHRNSRVPVVNRWRRPIFAVYLLACLVAMVPSYMAGELSPPVAVFFALWLFFGPILPSALGGADPERPGWIKLEGIVATDYERR